MDLFKFVFSFSSWAIKKARCYNGLMQYRTVLWRTNDGLATVVECVNMYFSTKTFSYEGEQNSKIAGIPVSDNTVYSLFSILL